MLPFGQQALFIGALFSAAAALAHLACIVWGAPAYRFMGAGERMAHAVESGKLKPTVATFFITGILGVWAAYALGGAGIIDRLPLSRVVLPAICAVYLGRSVAFPWLQPVFPENSRRFWLISSSICLVMGLVHLYGVVAVWDSL